MYITVYIFFYSVSDRFFFFFFEKDFGTCNEIEKYQQSAIVCKIYTYNVYIYIILYKPISNKSATLTVVFFGAPVDEAMLSVAGFEKAKLAGYCVESGMGWIAGCEGRMGGQVP